MRIAEIMTPDCKYCMDTDTVGDVAKMMAKEHIGAVPIGSGDKLVGVVTDRDIVTRCVANGGDCASTPAKSIMTDRILYCFDDQDTEEVARNLAEQHVRRMPVVNRDKRLVGMISLGDLSTRASDEDANRVLEGVADVNVPEGR